MANTPRHHAHAAGAWLHVIGEYWPSRCKQLISYLLVFSVLVRKVSRTMAVNCASVSCAKKSAISATVFVLGRGVRKSNRPSGLASLCLHIYFLAA